MTTIIKELMRSGFSQLSVTIFICVFTLPSLLFAEEPLRTYDRQSIRYPSMDTGQVWAKIRKNSYSNLNKESQLGNNDITQDRETKRVKKLPSKTSRSIRKSESQITSRQTDKKKDQNNSLNKTPQLTKVNFTEGMTSEIPKSHPGGEDRLHEQELYDSETPKSKQPGKNWNYKQVLYDVDCSEKKARTLVTYYFDKSDKPLGLKQTPEAKWYHIYPRSFEEQLYTEICNPR
jgi:hypothetical protein